jgi:hypothetical protein
MWEDPLVDEVRQVREKHAARFGYDLRKIYLDLKKQEKASGQQFVSYRPRRVTPQKKVKRSRVAA